MSNKIIEALRRTSTDLAMGDHHMDHGERLFGAPRPRPASNDKERLKLLSEALAKDIATMQSPLAQGFIDAGEQIAAELERLGDVSLAEGERRKKEFYKEAMLVRDKCRYQAAEALDFASELDKLRGFRKPSAEGYVRSKDVEPKHIKPEGDHAEERPESGEEVGSAVGIREEN